MRRPSSGRIWAVVSSSARSRARVSRSPRGMLISSGESCARPRTGWTSPTARRARAATAFISSSPGGRVGQPPSGSWRRQISRRCWTLTSSACRSLTSRPGRTMSLACLMKRRRVEELISMSRSSRHRLEAVAITRSAAERSKTSGMKMSRESRTPSSMSSCSHQSARVEAGVRPVPSAASSMCR